MARRQKGSKHYVKVKARAHAAQRYAANVRRDVAHQASHVIASDDSMWLIVMEALNLCNMTASAKGTNEQPGNNVRQKAGLNRALLSVGLGQIATYTAYKARRRAKLLLKVPPQYSSQECAHCGYIHPGNRVSRDRYACLRCGHADDADANASAVLKMRGIALLLSNAQVSKPVRRCGVTKKKQQKNGSGGMPRTGGEPSAYARGDPRKTQPEAVRSGCAAVEEARNPRYSAKRLAEGVFIF